MTYVSCFELLMQQIRDSMEIFYHYSLIEEFLCRRSREKQRVSINTGLALARSELVRVDCLGNLKSEIFLYGELVYEQ